MSALVADSSGHNVAGKLSSFVRAAAGRSTSVRVGCLIFSPLKARRKNDSYVGNGNIGMEMVRDVLHRHGINTGFCDVRTAANFDVVMVSFTSTYDLIAYYKAVAMLPYWQPGWRKFKVIGGGAGLLNPTVIREYLDFAAFGRCEDWIATVVDKVLCGKTPEHQSVMCLPELRKVLVGQAQELYPHKIGDWREQMLGCPNHCLFCLYSWSRRHVGDNNAYANLTLCGETSPEVMFLDLLKLDRKRGRIRCAIDGFSERLRYTYGKRISNDDIVAVVNHVGSFKGTTILLVYNICNMPGETDDDRLELYATLQRCEPKHRVIFVLHSTPFRPSLLTPAQYEKPSLSPEWSDMRGQVIVDRDNFRAVHSYTLESSWSHLQTLLVERATPDLDSAFHAMVFSPQLRKMDVRTALTEFCQTFNMVPVLREYEPGHHKFPGWFLESYTSQDKLVRITEAMRRKRSQW
jgi:hypothetical protein